MDEDSWQRNWDGFGVAYRAKIWVDEESLRTGDVRVATCHLRLDPNQRVVVLFNRERVQSIRIVEAEGIERATAEGHRVELVGGRRGARVCVELHTRALDPAGEGR